MIEGGQPSRRLALSVELRLTAESIEQVLNGHHLPVDIGDPRTPPASRSAVRDMAFSAVRDLGRLRALLGRLNKRTPAQPVFALQIAALAQLLDGRRAPAIVVDQAVSAARNARKTRGAANFLNAVLRRFLREKDQLLAAVADDPEASWGYPGWWIDIVREHYPGTWQAVLELGRRPPPLTLRVNPRKTCARAYNARLEAEGVPSHWLGEHAVVLERAVPVTQIPGFAEGQVSVQDAGAQMVAQLLPIEDGQRVLDACAAPGGKSAALLERYDVHLTALDHDADRLVRLRTGMERLGLAPAAIVAGDAASPHGWWDGEPFDAIVADVPCSASGIVRRHPEIRWLRSRRDITTFAALQAQILEGLWPTLRPGGKLLYATCSVFPMEGVDVVNAFVGRHPNAKRLTLHACLDGEVHAIDQLLPHASATREHDGFFYALIEKLR